MRATLSSAAQRGVILIDRPTRTPIFAILMWRKGRADAFA